MTLLHTDFEILPAADGDQDLRSYVLDCAKLGALPICQSLSAIEADQTKWGPDNSAISALIQEGAKQANRLLAMVLRGAGADQVVAEDDILFAARSLAAGDPAAWAVNKETLAALTGRAPSIRHSEPSLAWQRRTLSRVERRLIEPIDSDEGGQLAFQHTVFCQTSLPYKNPGDEVREWRRQQGAVALLVKAGEARDHHTGEWVRLGLPWGPKPRLLLAYLNTVALRQRSPVIEVGNSVSGFVKRIRGFASGKEIDQVKKQLSRLSVASISAATLHGGRGFQVNRGIVTGFELWSDPDDRQRVLWPSIIRLSLDYFESLQNHAVPLLEADLAALAHSALALDLYACLAQRLHRVNPKQPAFVTWAQLKEQFGPEYGRMNNFKAKFREALRQVRVRYQTARS